MTKNQIKWVGIIGSVASIIGLWFVFFPLSTDATKSNSETPQQVPPQNPTTEQTSKGDCAPNMSAVNVGGNVNNCASEDPAVKRP